MTKADIVNVLYERIGGFSKREANDLVDLVFETMKETLGRGEKIKISGYGNFLLRDKHERRGRNPRTGDAMPIRERRVLTFKPSDILKRSLNPRSGERHDGVGPVHGDGVRGRDGSAVRTRAGVGAPAHDGSASRSVPLGAVGLEGVAAGTREGVANEAGQ